MLHYHERTFATNWDANIYRGCEHNCKYCFAQFSPKERELILSSGKYVGDQSYIIKEANHYPINKDWKPVTEYYLGLKFKEKFFLDR